MLEDSMRSNCQVVLLLLVAVSSLSSQSAAPPSNPLGTSSNCDSVLKATAPPRFRTGRLKHTAIPKYPAAARDANRSGKVRLSATIGKDGKVRDVTVLEGNPVLADAAAKAIREWRYEPFRLDNVKVDVPTVVTVNFEANGQVEMSQEVSDPVASNAMPSASSGVSTNYPGPVYKVGGDVKPPRVLDSPDPSYAESARKAKLQGSVGWQWS